MDLQLDKQRFIICGASSGFGKAVAETLLREGARCIVVARRGDKLRENFAEFKDRVEIIEADITHPSTLDRIVEIAKTSTLHGAVINAGGPPAGTPLETDMQQWDDAYQLVMRWKIDLSLRLTPLLKENGYGRLLFIESKSVKQPIPLLVLSNSFRAGVIGFAKSLSMEVAGDGITVNVLAPGAHNTPAIERVIQKNSELNKISYEEAKARTVNSIPVGRMGEAGEIASLAAWLLSPHSGYVTGQTISHDGGSISGLFG
ncbi:MAG: SDR family oxidoreductase [Balneolaceae bacterium]